MNHNDEIDCSGMSCPLPVVKSKMKIDTMSPGEVLKIITTDPGSCKDIPAWANRVGHEMIEEAEENGKYYFLVKRGE
ncbi:MAG: sulfurtransferase TusA family protein [Poseidonia sp.]